MLNTEDIFMKLKEFQFGFADATKEYTRMPELFEIAFCDEKKVVDKLLNSYPFLLIGRKGVGKSAFSAKIQSISKKSKTLYAFPMNMNDFEFTTFAKTGIDEDIAGTQKYKTSWDFLLLFTIYKILFNVFQMTEDDNLTNIISLLDSMGFSIDSGYKSDVTKLSKLKIGAEIVKFDIEFEKEFNIKPKSYIERISLISEKMLSILSDVYLNNREIVIIIDGMDDILRYKKNRMEIIASLIRSADYLNDKMLLSNIKIKVIMLIREDIISMVNDPDLNKIIQDGSIYLNWNNRLSELKKLVNRRFLWANLSEDAANRCWDTIFPRKIKQKLSWDYVLDYTLYKPRDILQFLKYCQAEYPENTSLTLSETQNVLKIYSNRYFIEEMKNELAGLIDDEIISCIPSVFRKLGGRAFELTEINKLLIEQVPHKDISVNDTKLLLTYLFDAGYIGQLIESNKGRNMKKIITFKYRNPTARIDYYQKFITHQGLHSGLGVRK